MRVFRHFSKNIWRHHLFEWPESCIFYAGLAWVCTRVITHFTYWAGFLHKKTVFFVESVFLIFFIKLFIILYDNHYYRFEVATE